MTSSRSLSLFPNIEQVKIDYVSFDSFIPEVKLAKLKKLEVEFDQGQEYMLQTVIDNFPTLTHFKVVFNHPSDENAIYKSLKNISNLKHLIHFKFHLRLVNNNVRFCDLLKQMANNCRNLKSFNFRFIINDKNIRNKEIIKVFSELKAFPALKRLKLGLYFADEVEDIDVNQLFSFELFKGLSNITHLTLRSVRSQTMNKSILKDIDINLPKLQSLRIDHPFDTTPEEVTQMAKILSRLSRLETLKLKFESGVDFKPIEEQITKKCRKIREIKTKHFID